MWASESYEMQSNFILTTPTAFFLAEVFGSSDKERPADVAFSDFRKEKSAGEGHSDRVKTKVFSFWS